MSGFGYVDIECKQRGSEKDFDRLKREREKGSNRLEKNTQRR